MSMTLKDKITAWEPQAVWSEAGDGMWTVPAEKFHDLAARLRAEGFDFLRSLTGMDWGEEGFGAVYHLEASATGENVVLRTLTPSREKCGLPSVCDLWKAAELNEREVFDYFGIGFLNHPDMRRLFLRDDWVGYPLRKDYDPALNPLRMTNEVSMDSAPSFELTSDGSFIRKRNVLFEEDEYVINVGPQHPATHGVLRFRVSLEGEIIKKLDVHCGYIHRGIEKLCEGLTYPQTLALTDRLDYLGAAQNRHALCMCIEKGLGVEVSERVQYIRTIMDELQRIDSHLLFFACLCMDMGALTAFFYGFRDREKVLDTVTTNDPLAAFYKILLQFSDLFAVVTFILVSFNNRNDLSSQFLSLVRIQHIVDPFSEQFFYFSRSAISSNSLVHHFHETSTHLFVSQFHTQTEFTEVFEQ